VTTPYRCPECGSPLQLETEVVKGEHYMPAFHYWKDPLPVREVVVPAVAFCSGCEFVIEVRE
jgi:hypothetical protein